MTPIAIAGTNISSMVGGRVNLWENSKTRLGVMNPYDGKQIRQASHLKGQFRKQKFDDDILEFNSLYSIPGIVLGRGYRLA